MARLERSPHDADVTRAVKRVVTAAIRHFNQLFLYTLPTKLRRIDEMGRSKLLAPLLFRIVDIHDYNLARSILHTPLNNRQPDAASTKDCDVGPFFDAAVTSCDDRRAVASCDTAAQQARPIHSSLFGDGDDGNICNDGVLGECGGTHEVEQVFAFAFKSRGPIWHDSFTLCCADLAAEVRLARFAEFAFAAFGCAGKYAGQRLHIKERE